jgi:DNA-directed RNA polymerase specialized sigma24 family protein
MPMSSAGSVSHWIRLLKAGDHLAAQPLWEGYFQRLVRLARSRLQGLPRRAADEEDVALSAFESFCRGAEQGRFPQLADRDDLWQLLVVLTVRKAIDLREHEKCQKRGGGRVQDEAAFTDTQSSLTSVAGLEQIVGSEPTPEFAAQVAEECERLLALLDNDELRSLALWKMEGFTNEEIAGKLACVSRTVERKLRLIRNIWSREVVP